MKHLFILLAFFSLQSLISAVHAADAAPLPIRFCYEDKEVLPFYRGEGRAVPVNNPGANIEILRALEHSAGVEFELIRRPWLRCWDMLEKGSVDALVASFRSSRLGTLSYPVKDNEVDSQRAMSKAGVCFVGTQEFHEFWQSRHTSDKRMAVALPKGYGVSERLKHEPLTLINALSQDDAFKLVHNGRVSAMMDTCTADGKRTFVQRSNAKEIAPIYPPFEVNHGYLVFSHEFYDQNKAKIESLWDALGQQNNSQVLERYLNEYSYPR
ncbi:hypothetical protein AAEU32_15180 [Pseudoalteromonas sp. SSDWG2]|uniref:hypothetical protein n=1 Tax=Pseudoalteromonas sp. SSDWG2 TaxID=3139391 RepID=UPI003BABB71C